MMIQISLFTGEVRYNIPEKMYKILIKQFYIRLRAPLMLDKYFLALKKYILLYIYK